MKTLITLMALVIAGSALAGQVELRVNQGATPLPSCGGSVDAIKDGNGNVMVNFYNVQYCSNYNVLGANYQEINPREFPNQKLMGSNGNRNGSFDISPDLINLGKNVIVLQVRSNKYGSKKDTGAAHGDEIILKFKEKLPPAPTTTTNGSGW